MMFYSVCIPELHQNINIGKINGILYNIESILGINKLVIALTQLSKTHWYHNMVNCIKGEILQSPICLIIVYETAKLLCNFSLQDYLRM